jgi:hypothetical protein
MDEMERGVANEGFVFLKSHASFISVLDADIVDQHSHENITTTTFFDHFSF